MHAFSEIVLNTTWVLAIGSPLLKTSIIEEPFALVRERLNSSKSEKKAGKQSASRSTLCVSLTNARQNAPACPVASMTCSETYLR